MVKKKKRELRVEVFSSFEDENRAEHRRLALLTPMQRMEEFAILQERMWGKKWTEEPMVKIVTIEKLSWYRSSDRPKDLADADELEKTAKENHE